MSDSRSSALLPAAQQLPHTSPAAHNAESSSSAAAPLSRPVAHASSRSTKKAGLGCGLYWQRCRADACDILCAALQGVCSSKIAGTPTRLTSRPGPGVVLDHQAAETRHSLRVTWNQVGPRAQRCLGQAAKVSSRAGGQPA